MIGFIIGVLTMSIVGLLLYIRYLLKQPVVEAKKLEETRTNEEIRKEEEFKDHFNNMMNYNPAKAYGGK